MAGAHRSPACTPGAAPSPPPRWDPQEGRAAARPSRASGSIFLGTQHILPDSPTRVSATRSGLWTVRHRGKRALRPSSPSGRQSNSRVRSMTLLTPRAPTPVLLAAAQSIWAPASCPLRSHVPSPSIAPRPRPCRLSVALPPTQWRPARGQNPSPRGGLPPACSSSRARCPPMGWAKTGLLRAEAPPPGHKGRPRRSPGRTRTCHPAAASLSPRSGWSPA